MRRRCASICMLLSPLLVIISTDTCLAQQKPYTGAEIYSLASFRYGRITARIQSAPGSGIINGMFTYRNEAVPPENYHPEIDIEIFGRYFGRRWQSNIRVGQDYVDPNHENAAGPSEGFHQLFHCYSIEWTPDHVRWYVNRQMIREETNDDALSKLGYDCDIRFNVWPVAEALEDWAGVLDTDSLPAAMSIDWVEYERYNEGDGTFTVEWKDDFTSLDTDRWGLANYTFAGNRADFVPENVSIRDGALVLCLKERSGNNCDAIVVDTTKTMSCTTVNTVEGFSSPMLYQNYPNPCREFTSVTFSLPHAGNVAIRIIDVTGRTVSTVERGFVQTGVHTHHLDMSALFPGLYFYELSVGAISLSRRLIVLK